MINSNFFFKNGDVILLVVSKMNSKHSLMFSFVGLQKFKSLDIPEDFPFTNLLTLSQCKLNWELKVNFSGPHTSRITVNL